jgi:large subunit ribosomal protein L23
MNPVPSIVLEPLVTEKGTLLRGSLNQYFFKVAEGANRLQIRRAVEMHFNVKVLAIRTQRVYGKIKRYGRFQGRRPSWKKAIVTLSKNSKIELFEGI